MDYVDAIAPIPPIPEPSTLVLLATGLLGLLYCAWQRRLPTLLLVGLLLGGFGVSPASGADGDRKLTDSERTVLAESAAWGTITSLADGSLGLIYQNARTTEVGGVNVSMEWIHSIDGGLSWSTPITVAERLGSGGELFDTRDDGGYIVYEKRNQALGQLPSGRIVCSMANLDYYFDSAGNEEPQYNSISSNFRFAGMSYTYSDDYGQSWQPLESLPSGPFDDLYDGQDRFVGVSPHGRIVTLSDGTALMSVYGTPDPAYTGPLTVPAGTVSMAGVLRSTDNGLTWSDPSLIMARSGDFPYEETSLCLLPGDKLLAETRTPAGNVVQYTSDDLGRTWEGPTQLTEAGQHPGSAFQLADGTLMATWGNRRAPYGAMAMISTNGGKTWNYSNRVSLAWDAANGNCGYANGAQAGDGSIVVTYYDMSAGWWTESKVYAVRFTEEQFLAAAGVPDPSTGAGFFWDGSGDPTAHGFAIAPASPTPFQFDTENGSPQPGVAYQNTTADNALMGYYEAAVGLSNAEGWTVEARVQVLQNTGDHFGLFFSAEDEVGGVGALLFPDKIEWFNGGFDTFSATGLNDGALLTTAIDEGYHTLAITLAPNETAAHVWVDGIDQGTIDLTPGTYYARAVFGDGSSNSGGEANWDYVNVNDTAPEPSTLVMAGIGLACALGYVWRKRRRR